MSRLDYSKWDHIEISDDEDDTHPNVDTPSLFKWRHEARLQRMAEQQREKEELMKGKSDYQQRKAKIKREIEEAEKKKNETDLEKLKSEMSQLALQEKEFHAKEEELRKKEKSQPLNIDTICKEGKSKTIINKYKSAQAIVTDDERFEKQQDFTKSNEKLLKKFGMLKKYEDTQAFLEEHSHLACEETANYLVLWCINLEVEGKHDLMSHVAHQTIVMQFILELAKTLDTDPRACVKTFFQRMKTAVKQYMDAFNDELASFKDRIRARAKVRIEEAMKEVEEEERQERIKQSPGGLDPQEVFESLPLSIQECFEKRDIPMLQKAMTELPKEEAEYHLKRCIDSGLWVADASKVENTGDDAAKGDAAKVDDGCNSDEIYEDID